MQEVLMLIQVLTNGKNINVTLPKKEITQKQLQDIMLIKVLGGKK